MQAEYFPQRRKQKSGSIIFFFALLFLAPLPGCNKKPPRGETAGPTLFGFVRSVPESTRIVGASVFSCGAIERSDSLGFYSIFTLEFCVLENGLPVTVKATGYQTLDDTVTVIGSDAVRADFYLIRQP